MKEKTPPIVDRQDETAEQPTPPANPVKLSARGLSVEFTNRAGQTVTALEDLTLDVHAGEVVCIVGPSGCGKSTLLSAITGLATVSVGELDIDGVPVRRPGRNRALVFQQASLLPWRTVLKNVTYGLEPGKLSRSERLARARKYLSIVGLSRRENAYPRELSGGMQQRVNLARAMAIEPEILLFDEPFAALDAQTRELMQREVAGILERAGRTVLFVTHDIGEAILLADRIVVMTARPGRVLDIVDVDLPRPRTADVEQDPRFQEYRERIWRQIEAQVRLSGDFQFGSDT
jgi:NitT/TauT family transport system ATP-binding protein